MKLKLSSLFFCCLVITACGHPSKNSSSELNNDITANAVAHSQRPEFDVERDNIRSPETVLQFFNVQSGDQIAELLAADGYYTELISRCVGDEGTVYMQNNRQFFEFQTDKSVISRLENDRLPNVKRWDNELTNLNFQKESLDKVFMILVLHDFYWMEKDVDLIIQEVFQSLKPGGILGIIDHAAELGSGIQHATDMQGIHRVDSDFVVKTMLANGFVFDGQSNALSQSTDDRTKAFFHPSLKGKATDRFMMRFKKPEPLQ